MSEPREPHGLPAGQTDPASASTDGPETKTPAPAPPWDQSADASAGGEAPADDLFDAGPEEPYEPEARGSRGVRRGAVIAAVAVVLALVVGGAGTFGALAAAGRLRPDPTPVSTPVPTPMATPSISVDGNVVGAADAPVTVEIWADYQCPFCRLETIAYGPAIQREFVLSRKVRVVYRDFAFLGPESIDAAVAARCAGQQARDAYWRYHDILYVAQQGENQGTFSRDNLITYAKIAGLDQAALTSCLDDASVKAAVTGSTAEGRSLGITQTPTLRMIGPGGTRTLTGFSQTWATIADAIAAVVTPAVSASPEPSGSPASSGSPGSSGSDGSPAPNGSQPADGSASPAVSSTAP